MTSRANRILKLEHLMNELTWAEKEFSVEFSHKKYTEEKWREALANRKEITEEPTGFHIEFVEIEKNRPN